MSEICLQFPAPFFGHCPFFSEEKFSDVGGWAETLHLRRQNRYCVFDRCAVACALGAFAEAITSAIHPTKITREPKQFSTKQFRTAVPPTRGFQLFCRVFFDVGSAALPVPQGKAEGEDFVDRNVPPGGSGTPQPDRCHHRRLQLATERLAQHHHRPSVATHNSAVICGCKATCFCFSVPC